MGKKLAKVSASQDSEKTNKKFSRAKKEMPLNIFQELKRFESFKSTWLNLEEFVS